MASTEVPAEASIRITHIINPNHFYFKCENQSDGDFMKKLQAYCVEMAEYRRVEYAPKKGDYVGVYIVPWSKWVRAHVDHVLRSISGADKYVVWLLDDGIPLIADLTQIIPLPYELATKTESNVHLGSIDMYMPCVEEFNYEQMQREKAMANKWPVYAVKQFKRDVNKAYSLRFNNERKDETTGQYFGQLFSVMSSGRWKNIGEALMHSGAAIESTDLESDLRRMNVLSKNRWCNDDGVMTIANVAVSERDDSAARNDVAYDSHKKVMEWMRRNKAANGTHPIRTSTMPVNIQYDRMDCVHNYLETLPSMSSNAERLVQGTISSSRSTGQHARTGNDIIDEWN